MASIALAKFGNEYGPCKEYDCGHIDCNASREQADSICQLCSSPIGYGRHFYDDKDYGFVHAVCLEELIIERQERQART